MMMMMMMMMMMIVWVGVRTLQMMLGRRMALRLDHDGC
jgi:hypothetical protein